MKKKFECATVTDISVARSQRKLGEKLRHKPLQPVRKFVPFNGFDGQYLAGSGALVFEGELLGKVG